MNVGIFSGSFNPIHVGHLMLANYIVEFTGLDEVWFLVSPHNPLKENADLLHEDERMHMVKLALTQYPKLRASDFELSMPRPSYTIHTLEMLQKANHEHDFTLIIGADNWDSFEKWRDYEKIIAAFPIVIYPRMGYRISIPSKLKNMVKALDSPIIEISSTFIRDNIAEGKTLRAFIPQAVYEYIEEKKMYRK